MSKDVSDAFQKLMEKAVKEILANPESSVAQKLDAVDKGTRLMAIRLKFNPDKDGGGFFPSA